MASKSQSLESPNSSMSTEPVLIHSSSGAGDDEKLVPSGPGEEDMFQPKSIRFWLTLLSSFLALFLVALDRTIIATAVPRISDEFQALGDIGWYGSAYMLTTACAQLLFGRVYKFYDMKWVFLSSIIVFEIGSVICGAAPTSTVLIIGRAVAGLGAAGIFSGGVLVMIPMIPLHRRPAFQGLFGVVFGIASVMGPLVGGGFTGEVTWRWCFYINLPIGLVVLVLMCFYWNPPKEKRVPVAYKTHLTRLDPLGMLFFLPGVVCLFIAFQWGGTTYAWSNWRIILLLGLFSACVVVFIALQILMPDTASVPPRVIMQRSVACGTGFTFFLSGSMLMLVYYVPVWFQTVKQVDPIKSGIYTLPLVLSLVASSVAAGGITQKIGYYVPSMLLSPIIMSIGEGLLSTLDRDSPTAHWVAFQSLSGFGLGFGMQTSALAVQTVLPREDISTGIAINFFVQQLGGAVFTSVGQTILTNILVSELSNLPGFDPKLVVGEGATQLSQIVQPEDALQVINGYNHALRYVFLTSMGSAFASLFCALGMEWRSVKQGRTRGSLPGPANASDLSPQSLTAPETDDAKGSAGLAPVSPFSEGVNEPTEPEGSRRGFGILGTTREEPKEAGMQGVPEGRKRRVLTKPAPARHGSRRLPSLPSVRISLALEYSNIDLLEDTMRELARYYKDQGGDDKERDECSAEKKHDEYGARDGK
ncbi:hypothetical protein VTH06DRAFT_1919 [Thermothelomyces fergusii]